MKCKVEDVACQVAQFKLVCFLLLLLKARGGPRVAGAIESGTLGFLHVLYIGCRSVETGGLDGRTKMLQLPGFYCILYTAVWFQEYRER